MSLPKLETPTYELNLPSTNKKVKYRPFLVKEYKVLLTAIESSTDEIVRVLYELIDVCTFNKLDMNKLSHFDIEFLFLQIRAKSISEIAAITVNCDCGEKIPYDLDITKAEIVRGKEIKDDNKILITDTVGVEMRYPKFNEVLDIYENLRNDKAIDLIKNCIDAVFTPDSYQDRSSFTEEELDEFMGSFSKQQFDKLEQFFINMPKVVQHIETNCPACGTLNIVDLEGIQNFFV
jgi:hypothetical protein